MASIMYSNVEFPATVSLDFHSDISSQSVPTHWIIAIEEITVEQDSLPGNGRRSGNVFKGYWNQRLVAVKLLSKEARVDNLVDRIQIWRSLRHPLVLQVFGISQLGTHTPLIISQYCPGNASEFFVKNPDADRTDIIFGCALGMLYLHGHGLVHGSLKPANILVSEDGQARIADYDMIGITPSANILPQRYFSPEAWLLGTISCPSDVFAFAMSAYELFTSTPPWGVLSKDEIFQCVVRRNERPPRSNPEVERRVGLTDRIWEILQNAWGEKVVFRPSFAQIVQKWRDQSAMENSSSALENIAELAISADGSSLDSQGCLDELHACGAYEVVDGPPAYRDLSIRRPVAHRDLNMRTRPHLFNTIRSATEGHSRLDHNQSPDFASRTEDGSILYPPSPFLGPSAHVGPDSSLSKGSSRIVRLFPQVSTLPSVPETEENLVSQSRTNRSNEISRMKANPGNHICDPTWHDRQMSAYPVVTGMGDQSSRNPHGTLGAARDRAPNAVLLAGALHAEVSEGRKPQVIDEYLLKAQVLSLQSCKQVQKLVTAGIVHTVVLLLKARAVDGVGLEIVLTTLGLLGCDIITANTIYRTNTVFTLIEIIRSSHSDDSVTLSIWCLSRICQNEDLAASLVKQDLTTILLQKGLKGSQPISRLSAWCLGSLAYTNELAETLWSHGAVAAAIDHLRNCTGRSNMQPEDICAALYFVARMSRTIPLSKALARAGCVPLIVHHFSTSENPQILNWSARAVGCLMRPSSVDMAKYLLDAGCAQALARLPRVLQTEEIEPLTSFAFAIQRFSYAEWGEGTRKALVEAGVVDSLLSAMRTAADVPYPQVHVQLALAVSSLGDIGGKLVRQEIIRAGGIEILERVGAEGVPEVAKACRIAAASISGNFWVRNAASARTGMVHNWNGGCPEHLPPCPLTLTVEENFN